MTHENQHPLAGRTVRLDHVARDPREIIVPGAEFVVRDWVDRLGLRNSWKREENWATTHYAARQKMSVFYTTEQPYSKIALPDDEEVVYGKIGGLGHCVHASEFGEVIE